MNKCVAVFGAGLSGRSVAKLAKSEGHNVTIFDEKIGWKNNFCKSDVACFHDFVFSPGFPKNHPWRVILSGHESLYGELGYAAERWKGKVFAVTGTNGKTTVSRLLKEALCASGLEAYIAGNIGLPFSDLVNSTANHKHAIAVCEISSFQAEITKGMSLDALIWTNFAEDHLDRYGNLEEYFQCKFALFSCLKKQPTICIGEDLLEFKSANFWRTHGAKIIKVDRGLSSLIDRTSVFQSYPHLLNFNLVCGFIEALGLKEVDVVSLANDFKLDKHRLSKIFEKEGLRIWEDSKSTNLHSVLGAIKEMKGKVIWIGGGASKNTDISKFTSSLAPLLDSVVVYGEAGKALNEAFLNLGIDCNYYLKLEDAIRASILLSEAQKEVNLLFSPGFASFDQFNSYSDRGIFFQKTIFSLLKG